MTKPKAIENKVRGTKRSRSRGAGITMPVATISSTPPAPKTEVKARSSPRQAGAIRGVLRITVKSFLPEFADMDLKQIPVPTFLTWLQLLDNKNVNVDRDLHMIKTPKTTSLLDDKISKTMESYSKNCNRMIVSIVPLQAILLQQVQSPEVNPDQNEQASQTNSLDEISDEENINENINDGDSEGFEVNPDTSDNVNLPLEEENDGMDYSGSEEEEEEGELQQDNINTEPPHPINSRRILNPSRFFGSRGPRITDSLNMTCTNSPPSPVNLMSTSARLREVTKQAELLKNLFRFGRPNRMAPPLEEMDSISTQNSQLSQEDEEILENYEERQNLKDQVINEFRQLPLEDLLKMRDELVAMQNENRRYQWSRHAPMTSCAIMSAFRL